eukprot:754784-Hanusia_phi.AAC.2
MGLCLSTHSEVPPSEGVCGFLVEVCPSAGETVSFFTVVDELFFGEAFVAYGRNLFVKPVDTCFKSNVGSDRRVETLGSQETIVTANKFESTQGENIQSRKISHRALGSTTACYIIS